MLFLQGYILTSEIDGTIQLKSYLTGNPEIRLALNEEVGIGRGGESIYGNLYTIENAFRMSVVFFNYPSCIVCWYC